MSKAQAKAGSTVKIHYQASVSDGTVLESTYDRAPLQLTLGEGKGIPGLDSAIIGMREGEMNSVAISGDEVYGPHKQKLVKVVRRTLLPAEMQPRVGKKVRITTRRGRQQDAVITDVTDDAVTLDANHPLSGRDLRYKVLLLEVL